MTTAIEPHRIEKADIIAAIIKDAQDAIELATGERVRLVAEKALEPHSIGRIASVVCEIFGVTLTHLKSESRLRRIIDAKKAFIMLYYSVHPMDLSHKKLSLFLQRDRNSVRHLYNEGGNLLILDPSFEEKYQVCRAEIEKK